MQGSLTGALSQALRGAWPDRPTFACGGHRRYWRPASATVRPSSRTVHPPTHQHRPSSRDGSRLLSPPLSAATSRRPSKGTIVCTTMNFCTSAMYHMQRPQLCAGHGQRHRPIKVGMAMRQLKLRGSAGPSYRRPDTIHATWARARPAWPAPGRWLGQSTRWWAAGGR